MEEKKKRGINERPLPLVLLILAIVMVGLAIIALCMGAYDVSVSQTVKILWSQLFDITQDWPKMAETVIVQVRLPRIIGALLVGAALAVAGTAYQSIFRNPLVSPDLLGVSNGACIGAAGAILFGAGSLGIQGAAFVGGILAVCATMSIPKLLRRESTMTLVLSGIIVGGFCTSIMGIIKYVADPETQLPDIVYWQMGSLAKVDWESLKYVAPVILISIIVIIAMRWRINVLSLGDHTAKALGVNLKLERSIVIAFATLLTASAVCLAGTIGWIGLVMPHLARFIVGPNTSRSLPAVALLAASFMLVVDTIARIFGIEIPLSIITGFIGAPFFIILLARQRQIE